MATTIETSVILPETLVTQAEALARQLGISRDQVFGAAIERYLRATPPGPAQHSNGPRPAINRGDIFWVQLDDPAGSELGIPHPHVIIQDDVFNHSRVASVVACALTSNVNRANSPGNVLLDAGEGNLPKPSVAEVSKVSAVEKARLGSYIGSLDVRRIDEILAGMRFLQRSYF